MIDKAKSKGRIEEWAAVAVGGAPETDPLRIVGKFGGKDIITSAAIDVAGRFVLTRSGSVYELGTVHPDYLAELRANRYPFDPENPIKQLSAEARERTSIAPRTRIN